VDVKVDYRILTTCKRFLIIMSSHLLPILIGSTIFSYPIKPKRGYISKSKLGDELRLSLGVTALK